MVKPQKYIEDRFPLTIWRTDAVFGDMSRTSCDPPIYCKGDGALEQGEISSEMNIFSLYLILPGFTLTNLVSTMLDR